MKAHLACTCIGIGCSANRISSICGVPQQWEVGIFQIDRGHKTVWGHESHSRPKGVHFEMVFLNVLIELF